MFWNAFKDANGDWALEELVAVPAVVAGIGGYFYDCFGRGHPFDILAFMGGVGAGIVALASAKRARGDVQGDAARRGGGGQ